MSTFREAMRWAVAGLRCKLGGHQWARAKRIIGNVGERTCRRCGWRAPVTLRERAQPIAQPDAPSDERYV